MNDGMLGRNLAPVFDLRITRNPNQDAQILWYVA